MSLAANRASRRALLAGASGALAWGLADRALAGEVAAAMADTMADDGAARRSEAQRAAEAMPMPETRPRPLPPRLEPRPARPRSALWLRRPGGDEIAVRFRDEGGYDRAGIGRLSWFLRDTADRDRAVWMEPRLLDLLAAVQDGLSAVNGAPLPLVVTSAYRTPEHNASIETAARNSLHLYGCAADIRVPPFSPRSIAVAASLLAGGGIGLYEEFTHLDVGAVRSWAGPPRRLAPQQPPVG